MKGLLFIFSYGIICFAAGSYIELDPDDTLLYTRDLSNHARLVQRSSGYNFGFLPQTLLTRRGEASTGRINPTTLRQGKGGSGLRQRHSRGGSPSRDRNLNSKASVEGQGPADLWTFNSARPGDHDDVQQRHVTFGMQDTLRTQHHISAAAGGKTTGTPPPNVSQQSTANHSLKAKAQGRTAVGSVAAPSGGHGNIKIETPGATENVLVPGGTSMIDGTHTPGANDAKVEASVTRGGKAQAGAQFLDGAAPFHQSQNRRK